MMVLDRWTAIRRTSALAPRGVHASDTPNKYYKKILEILRTVYYNELIRVRTSGSRVDVRAPGSAGAGSARCTANKAPTHDRTRAEWPRSAREADEAYSYSSTNWTLFSFTFTANV